MKRVCYFHAGCPDGFGAAWSVWRSWGDDARYVPLSHDDVLRTDGTDGAWVVFADIAPDNDGMRELAERAARLVVLDHHLTAADRYHSDPGVANQIEAGGHEVVFDLEQSGAVLAWRYFHPDVPTPELLSYVQDQDLWHWALPGSDAVNAAIGSHRREFQVWDELEERGVKELAREGEPILRAQRSDVRRSLRFAHPLHISGIQVEAVNAQHYRSHIGHELAKRAAYGHAIGVVYRVGSATVDASIYSIGDTNVAEIAREHGGGGHRNASGFSVPLKRWIEEFC